MGVINITQRSERLGNIGGTSAAHGVTNTDIGTVRHTSARVFSPTYYSRNSHAGDAAITSGLGKIGDTLTRIGVAVMQREEDRKVDEYTNAMIRTMELESRDDREITDWNTPERQHLRGQKRGYYLRTGKGTMNVAQEWDDCFGERFNQIGTSIDANDRVRERTMKNLATYRRSTLSRLADQQASEYRRLELGNAEGTLTTQVNRFRNGDDSAIPEVFKQYDRVSQLKLLTPEQAQAGKEELALKLAATVIGRQVTGCQTPEDFDLVEADIKSGMKDRLPIEIADNLPGGERTIGGEYRKAILGEVKKAKRLFLAERDAEEREARQAVGRDFTERELKLRDVPQELWADAYEAMGRDETLRKADPKRAMAYMDAASEMRTAASKAKEEASADAIKGNEENLARALATLDIMKMEGSLPQDEANEAQAAIWRKFRALSLGKQLSPSFMRSFETRLSSQLTDQEANAMRKFYQAFGYKGEVNARGEIPASDRKNDTSDYAAPRNPGDRHSENYFRIPASELFVYGDTLLHTLRALGPDMNREGVVEKEIARLKTDWGKRQYDKNRDATVRSVMDMQREARTRWEMARPEERREDDDGRRKDGDTAK